jgi:branched-chain amino acid transport system permease protein
MRAIGYNTWAYKYVAYLIAGIFGSLAGVLFTYFNRYVNPSVLSIELSGTAMFMVIIGGRNLLFGPVIGAAIVLLLQYSISSLTEYWQLYLGIIFIASVMYARKGIGVYFLNYVLRTNK